MKLIRLACAAGVLVSGGCAESLTAPPPSGPEYFDGPPGSGYFVVRGPTGGAMGTPPLIVVDGRILNDAAEIQAIDQAKIEDVQVLKGAAAIERFGRRGSHGVILITLKQAR